MNDLGKIEDAGAIVRGGGIDRHWQTIKPEKKFLDMFGEKRKATWLFDSNLALEHFNLRSIEFGNWMSQQDRANFLYASALSLHYLAVLLGVKDSDIGFNGRLSLALGARGSGRAMGHYEATPYSVINLTKPHGMFGVLAHEYAHALDNIISHFTTKNKKFVSGGRITRRGYDKDIVKNGNYFEKQFEEFFNRLYFNENGEATTFSAAIRNKNKGDYYERRNEVFARSFEVYIWNLLKDVNIKNTFLVASSYNDSVYPNPTLSALVKPIIDSIVVKGFKEIAKHKNTLQGIKPTGYKGFRKTLKEHANLDDTLAAMKHITLRDYKQVEGLARELQGSSVRETSQNIWHYLRETTEYKLDRQGIEELRTPARSLHDGQKGVTDDRFGIDCDDYTILISALLLNLGIPHEYRVVAYEEVGKFQHIYPVAFDKKGTSYIIDVVPEIPHFNYEENPIIDLKIIPMELHELSGVEPDVMDEEIPVTDEELINEYAEELEYEIDNDLGELNNLDVEHEILKAYSQELNDSVQLEGIDDDYEEDEEEIFDDGFLSGFEEVEDEDDAEIVLGSTSEAIELVDRGLLVEVNKARQTLRKERSKPTALSQLVDINKELRLLDDVMESWEEPELRNDALNTAIRSKSHFMPFFLALQKALKELETDQLSGFDEELDEPIFLARIPEYDYEDDEETIDYEAYQEEQTQYDQRLGFLKKLWKGVKKGVKKAGKAVKSGLKKAVKLVARWNPIALAGRGAVSSVLMLNMFGFSKKLMYGLLTEVQARKAGLDLNEWKRRVKALKKTEDFFIKMFSGKRSGIKKAILRSRVAKRSGLPLSGLGAAATASTAAASPFIIFVKKLLSKLKPIKKFVKKVVNKVKGKKTPSPTSATSFSTPRSNFTRPANTYARPMNTISNSNSNFAMPIQNEKFMDRVKRIFTTHKKKFIFGIVITVFAIVGVNYYKKQQQKKKRSLAGIKAAKTRARNRKKLAAPARRNTVARKLRNPKRRSVPKKRSVTRALPARTINGTRKRKTSNASRLKAMHRKAKQLQKQHPKTKYSTLLKKAAAQL